MKAHAPEGSVVISFDEKGKTPVKRFGGRLWQAAKHYCIPYAQKVKGLFDIFGARNVHSGQRHYKFYDWKNSFIVIDFLQWLVREVYPDKIVHVILDGWSCHKSAALQAALVFESRLKLHFLPKCASWLNPIERDFSRVQTELLDNSDFQTPAEAIEAVSLFVEKVLQKSGSPI